MIVTIDGPAGAGKSTVSRCLAERLKFRFLDTGAMYRAVALAARQRGYEQAGDDRWAQVAREISIHLTDDRVLLDGQDVTEEIRRPELTAIIYRAADNPHVRERLVELQRLYAQGKDLVTEGRDQGTVVFPQAECKIFLTASPGARAQRRRADLLARGQDVPLEQILADQNIRDQRDSTREVGPLLKAPDAIEVLTDKMNQEQVVDHLEQLVRDRLVRLESSAS